MSIMTGIRAWSGSRSDELKNSSTPTTFPAAMIGNANALIMPARAASGARAKRLSSSMKRGTHNASAVSQTMPITVDAFAETGDGNLLGNLLDSLLHTIDATPGNLAVLSENLNALLAKVVGVLNAADLIVSPTVIDALPEVLQTLLSPVLIAQNPGEMTQILDLAIASPDGIDSSNA